MQAIPPFCSTGFQILTSPATPIPAQSISPKNPQRRNFPVLAWVPDVAAAMRQKLSYETLPLMHPSCECVAFYPQRRGVMPPLGSGETVALWRQIYGGRDASVNRPQNPPRLRMLQHVFPQPVILLGTYLSKLIITEGQVAVGIEAGGNTQSVC